MRGIEAQPNVIVRVQSAVQNGEAHAMLQSLGSRGAPSRDGSTVSRAIEAPSYTTCT